MQVYWMISFIHLNYQLDIIWNVDHDSLSLLDKKVKTVHVSLSQELADSMSLKLSLDDKHLSSNASSNEITKKNQEASSGRISAMRI